MATTLKKLRVVEDVAPDGYNTEQQLEAMRAGAYGRAPVGVGGAARATRNNVSLLEMDHGRPRSANI